jgi:hypothetical protein
MVEQMASIILLLCAKKVNIRANRNINELPLTP